MHLSAVRTRLLSTLVISALAATSVAALAPDASAATAPAVTLLSSHDGKITGGTTLTVNGTGFASGAAVLFGTTAGTGVRIVSAKQLTVLVPAHAAGVVDVRVRQGTLTSAITTADRYT